MMIQRFGENPQEVTIDPEIVKNMDDAEKFLQREFNKIRRDDGRSIECKVVGDAKWKTGNWVRVYLPSYFIDDYMYITKVSNDEDGGNNWTTGLTLVDYPPSFGTFVEETVENLEDGENTEEENAEETTGAKNAKGSDIAQSSQKITKNTNNKETVIIIVPPEDKKPEEMV